VEVRSPKLGERWHRLATGTRRWLVEDRGVRWLALFCACAVVELGYVFIASAGRFTNWPTYESRVDELAEAFRAGQLHLLKEPSPALVAAKNPFDPANSRLWYWDASLYKGHYYNYWGPVPALLLAAVKTALRATEPLGDQYPSFALVSLQLCAGAVLLERLARRLFGGIPSHLVMLAVVAFGLANPTPFMLARLGVYESAIIGGHAFLLTGVALAFEAVHCADVPRRSFAFAAAAGFAWALALGCRISLVPAIPFLVLTTALAMAWRHDGRWKRLSKSLVAMGAPLALGVGALLAYNKARFEHWFEFGQRFQLTWIDWKISTDFVAANAYSYAFRPTPISCKFPFLVSSIGMSPELAFPKGFKLPEHYSVYEQVAGVFLTTPWAWFALPAFAALGRYAWRALRTKGPSDAVAVSTLWALGTLSFASSLTLVAPLVVSGPTMRYLGDAAPAFMLLASLGAFALYDALRRVAVARWLAVSLFVAAALASSAVGLAYGFQGYYTHFKQHNPALLDKLEKRYSVCTPPKP
jgi:hypothetical protein